MTKDELLIRLKEGQWVDKDEMHRRSNALRAVIELHGSPETVDGVTRWIANGCAACSHGNPCPTLNAIEKELA